MTEAIRELRAARTLPNQEHPKAPAVAAGSAPVTRRERLATLDIVRGFALLGILAVNIEDFSGYEGLHDVPLGLIKPAFAGWHAHLDVLILAFKWLFVEGKMRGLFAMMFGASSVLLLERIEHRSSSLSAKFTFLRRNVLLVLFGLLHGALIWHGDILFMYGCCGLVVPLLFYRLGWRKLLAVGLAVWALYALVLMPRFLDARYSQGLPAGQSYVSLSIDRFTQPHTPAQIAAYQAADQQNNAKAAASVARRVAKNRSQTYVASVVSRASEIFPMLLIVVSSGFISELVAAMIVGMGLYKVGFFSGQLSNRTYFTIALVGYAIAAPITFIGVWNADTHMFSKQAVMFWMYLPYGVQQLPATLANASLLLLFARLGWFKSALGRLQAVGQTAFSNYIMTSLICQFIFVWSGWGLYGQLEYYQGLYVTAFVWAINLILSPIWLRHFAFGPLEWVWRCLTYGRFQTFRLAR